MNPLVSPAEVAAAPQWRVFDCSHDLADPARGQALYAEGHLPGALHAHLDTVLAGPRDGRNGRHPLPDPAVLAAWLGQAGVTRADTVVACDRSGGAFAARLWWLLRWLGHERVAVLDGGVPAWVAEGRLLTQEVPAFVPTVYELRPDRSRWVDAAQVAAMLQGGAGVIVDARAASRYAGVGETLDPVGGHIPGAINRPYADNLQPDGRFKPAAVLRQEWQAVLAGQPPAAVVSQCGSGVTACHNLLALEVAGWPGARLYPGSWSEWCSDPARPVATGPLP